MSELTNDGVTCVCEPSGCGNNRACYTCFPYTSRRDWMSLRDQLRQAESERTLKANGGQVIDVPMPTQVRVLVYQKQPGPDVAPAGGVVNYWAGQWCVKVMARAVDVQTGEIGDFSQETITADRPTRADIAHALSAWLAHEMQEQLGMRPHELAPGTASPDAKIVVVADDGSIVEYT